MYLECAVRGAGARRRRSAGAQPRGRLLPRRPRAIPDRLLHCIQRSRRAAGAGEHGAVRRAETYRSLRDPTGYSFNLDGSTLYLSLASVFVAQAAGVNLSFGQQLLMMPTLMPTSKGGAGVPRAALAILAGTLSAFRRAQ